uniref:Jumonji domain containing 8 n=1 Tax=Hippocampus comes TaxID=109280 RepID=A0A3Q2XMF9_HIPCM
MKVRVTWKWWTVPPCHYVISWTGMPDACPLVRVSFLASMLARELTAAKVMLLCCFHSYAYSTPVVITGLTDNTKFRSLCSKWNLLTTYGDRQVRLSTANTYSYTKVDMSFRDYVDDLLRPQSPDVLGSDTLYMFGDNNLSEWRSLLDVYEPPAFLLPGTHRAFSFGIAGPGTGVPFHWHGPGFSEVIYGRKRWFLYPPDEGPPFHPNMSTLSWLRDVYPGLPPHQAPLQCTIRPGQVLYFPDRWWHATLNLDTSIFISTFLG